MNTESFWIKTSADGEFPKLSEELSADAVIIGGGITGVTTAQLLSASGKKVVVLEAMKVGFGTTGCSTGNLHADIDEYLHPIEMKWGADAAREVMKSRTGIIDFIEQTAVGYDIPCGFVRRPHFIFPVSEREAELMRMEHRALQAAGLHVEIVNDVPLPFPVKQALKIEAQAQFHPLNYVRQLAKKIASDNCRICEHSPASNIDYRAASVSTPEGKVNAPIIVMATHTPKGIDLLQTMIGPYREYAVAAKLKDDRYPDGLFWSLEKPSHSIRSYEAGGAKHLLIIGEEHKVGQQGSVDYFEKVEQFANSHFNVDSFTARWSAQNYRPADGLPYIGLTSEHDNVYVATGFATNGLIYGALAASIISDHILGRRNPFQDLYSARRFTPLKTAKDFLMENINIAKEYFRDYVLQADFRSADAVKPGTGELVKFEGQNFAVWRDESGKATVLNPKCPHLKCIVHWNPMEGTWDCPCHGSRFKATGGFIEGPAITGLE